MISSEEIPRTIESNDSDYFLMHHKIVSNDLEFNNNEFSSRDVVLSKGELGEKLLIK